MASLFNSRGIKQFFNKHSADMRAYIGDRGEDNLLSISNIDKYIVDLLQMKKFRIIVPEINQDNIQKDIVKDPDTPFDRAKYTIRYSGTTELLYCSPLPPATINMIQHDVQIIPDILPDNADEGGVIIYYLSNKSKLTDNIKSLERIREMHLLNIEKIISNLGLLAVDVESYIVTMKIEMNKYISKKIGDIQARKRSEELL